MSETLKEEIPSPFVITLKSKALSNCAGLSETNKYAAAYFTAINAELPSPIVLIRKIIFNDEIVDGHLDTCATHCFISKQCSKELSSKNNLPIQITPFPVGQGSRLPDATEIHLCSLWLVSTKNEVVGFNKVVFLVVNTGAKILLANNILDHLGILKYHPPLGYEKLLEIKLQNSSVHPNQRALNPSPNSIQQMILTGQCMVTISTNHEANQTKPPASIESNPNDDFAKNGKEPGMKRNAAGPTEQRPQMTKEERKQKIQEAESLVVGAEPPSKIEIKVALDLLKRIAENPNEHGCSESELAEMQKELAQNRPEWAECLTPAHTSTTSEDAAKAKEEITHMMDFRFAKTVFTKTLEKPCCFAPFEINLKRDALPERSIQPRRFKDPSIVKLIDDWTDTLLRDRMIRESHTSVAAPITVVVKKGREPRVCVDYRERNARTDCPIFPMPDVHDFLDDAAGFPLYCSFDCAKMFNQYEIKEGHQHLAAFITHRGTYEPNRVMFGLQGGPQHAVRSARPAMKEHENTNGTAFTRWARQQNEEGENPPYYIDPKTGIVPGSRLDIFIDDCRIPSKTPKAMIKLCELWFLFCEEHRLVLSRKKAKICLLHLPLLGFVVSEKGKHLDPGRISSLLEAPTPASKEGLHALLCSYNFVRMFIPNFSVLAAPLYAATQGIIWKGPGSGRSRGTRNFDPDFKWDEKLQRCLRQLQTALLGAPILLVPNYSIALFLSVDACLKGEGWVLWQILVGKNGNLIPVAIRYGSTKYGDAESTWEVTRQEAHAIQSALKDCYDYLFYCHFYLLTDHRNLTFLSNSVNRAVIRIRYYMQQFNMTVVHVPGNWNNPADGISRLDTRELPVHQASNLNSSTIMEASSEFGKISRGTNSTNPNVTLEPEDLLVSCQARSINESDTSSAEVMFTSGSKCIECPNGLSCFLCNNQMEEDEEVIAQALVTLRFDTSTPQPDPNAFTYVEEEVEDDVRRIVFEGRCFLAKSQQEEESTQWASRLAIVHVQNDQPQESLETPEPTRKVTYFNRDVAVTGSVIQPPPPFKDFQDYGSQTTPGDFRAMKMEMPHLKDFQAIHNNEEGHHGLAHSYRKLIVRCGSLWAEERSTATQIREELKAFIENCPICQKVRGLQDKIKSKHSFIISRPFLEASYDFIVFEKTDKNGNRYIIVVVDNFSKLVELKSVATRGSENVAVFLMEIKARYGPIHRLRSDREKAFSSDVISRLNTLAGTEMVQCVVYHPQANSVCERQNQIIMVHLRSLCYGAKLGNDSVYSWSDLLPFVYSIVNNTPKLPLAISPLSMIYGVFANYDRPLLDPRPNSTLSNPVDYVDGLMEWQSKLIELAEDIQSKYYSKMVDERQVHRSFQEGDFVLQSKTSTSLRGKLITRWVGPRLVLARRNNDKHHPVLDLQDLVTNKVIEASIEDCRLLKTGWFEETTMLHDLKQLAALDKEEYEVQAIIAHRPPGPIRRPGIKPSDYWFKVKWAGFSNSEDSWEPYNELKTLAPLEEYLINFPELKL